MRLHLLPLALGVLLGCDSGKTKSYQDPEPIPPRCGDGIRNGSELCEGSDLGGASCKNQGYAGGVLRCGPDCTFDTTDCSRTCGNGVLDPTEECEGADFNGQSCELWGVFTCSPLCKVGRQSCLDNPFEQAQRISLSNPARAFFGAHKDGALATTDLYVFRPADHRFEIFNFTAGQGYDPLKGRVVALDPDLTAVAPAVADFNGDGTADLAVGYATTHQLALRLSASGSFAAAQRFDVGCEPLQLWPADLDGDGDLDLLVGCKLDGARFDRLAILRNDGASFAPVAPFAIPEAASFLQVVPGAASSAPALFLQLPSTGSVAILESGAPMAFADSGRRLATGQVPGEFVAVDLEGRGSLDLVIAEGTAVAQLRAGASGVYQRTEVASGLTAPRLLRAADLDLDGLPDLALVNGADLMVLKNVGGLLGGKQQVLPLALSAESLEPGDEDRDGDLDLAAAGADSGKGAVLLFRNRVK